MIIDAVIYGPIPKANIETLPKAPPVNISRNPTRSLALPEFNKAVLLIPKIGI